MKNIDKKAMSAMRAPPFSLKKTFFQLKIRLLNSL